MPFKDPEKKREYRRKWYKENKISERNHVRRRKKEIKKWFHEFKSKLCCSKCGENHPAIIDFHHTGKKENQVAQMVHWGYSIDKIKKELEKCQVLCANCHRKLHWRESKNL